MKASTMAAIAAGAVVFTGVGVIYAKKRLMPPAPPQLTPGTPGGIPHTDYTLPAGQSGTTTLGVSKPNGTYITLFVPAGGTWDSLVLAPSGTEVPVSAAEPATFHASPEVGTPAQAVATWHDAHGTYVTTILLPSG